MIKKNSSAHFRGFTLIEMIVSLGIFGFVSIMAVSSFLFMVVSQRKAINIQSTYDDLRYSIEVVSKELRTGDNYYCGTFSGDITTLAPKDCPPPNGLQAITFINAQGEMITYRYNFKPVNGVSIGVMERSVNGGAFEQATGDNSNIQDLKFYVTGARSSADEIASGDLPTQSIITLVVRGQNGSGKELSKFDLETTVTQRFVK